MSSSPRRRLGIGSWPGAAECCCACSRWVRGCPLCFPQAGESAWDRCGPHDYPSSLFDWYATERADPFCPAAPAERDASTAGATVVFDLVPSLPELHTHRSPELHTHRSPDIVLFVVLRQYSLEHIENFDIEHCSELVVPRTCHSVFAWERHCMELEAFAEHVSVDHQQLDSDNSFVLQIAVAGRQLGSFVRRGYIADCSLQVADREPGTFAFRLVGHTAPG